MAALVLLPIPLTFLLLLSLPTPLKVRKIIMNICSKTLAIQSFGALTLFHFMMIVSALTFAGQVYATQQVRPQSVSVFRPLGVDQTLFPMCRRTKLSVYYSAVHCILF